jgi:putative peptidoglycan lipid II flippase
MSSRLRKTAPKPDRVADREDRESHPEFHHEAAREPNQQHSLGRSTSTMAIGTLLSRLTGAIRSFVFLSFGTTALADAYQVGNTTPNMLYELVAGGVLSATLVPIFLALTRKKSRRAQDGIDAIVSIVTVVMIATVAITASAAPLIMKLFVRGPEKQQLAAQLLRMFAPQIALYGLVTVATAMLNAKRRFAAPMFAPILNNLMVIGVLLWVQHLVNALKNSAKTPGADSLESLRLVLSDTSSKLWLGFGTTAGILVMALAHLPSMRASGYRFRWHWEPRHPAVRELARLSKWTFGYVVANQVALQFVIWAARSRNGDYTAYSLAFSTFFLLPHGVFAVSIMTGIQPDLAEAFLDRKRARFRNRLAFGIQSILAIMIPAAAGYVVLSRPIVALIRSGDLSASGSNLIADTLAIFAIGLPSFSVYLLLMNALKAMRSTKLTYNVNAVECALNILIAAIAFRLGFGVQGLAFGVSAAYILSAFLAFAVVSKKTNGLHRSEVLTKISRICLASAAMAIVTGGVAYLLAQIFVGENPPIDLGSKFGLICQVGGSIGAGVSVYGVVGKRVGITELDAIIGTLQRRFLKH